MSLFAAFLLALCAVSLISFNTPMEYELRIEQLPEKNPAANSNEVWIIALGEDVTPISTVKGELPAGWVQRENAVVLAGENPPVFTWHAKNEGMHIVTLLTHTYSGKVRISVNNFSREYDLYSASGELYLSKVDFFPVFIKYIFPLFIPDFLFFFLCFFIVIFILTLILFRCFAFYKISTGWKLEFSVIFIFLLLVSISSFYPGWMTSDSIDQYSQSLSGKYHTWHPVMMAWWWSLLNYIKSGSELFLIQNLLFYWISFYIISFQLKKHIGHNPFILLFFAVTPQCMAIMGLLSKDIVFSVCCMLSLSIVFYAYINNCFTFKIRLFLFFLLTLAVGCKPNGIFVAVIILVWWIMNDHIFLSVTTRFIALFVSLIFISISSSVLVYSLNALKISQIQYIQVYDLLGIGVSKDQIFLPSYIVNKTHLTTESSRKIYSISSNDYLYYHTKAGNLRTTNSRELDELNSRWIKAIMEYPANYFETRYILFKSLLRINQEVPARIHSGDSDENPWGITFTPNIVSKIYKESTNKCPWLFFPWIYLILTIVSGISTPLMNKKVRQFNVVLTLCALSFTLPHFFITPATDYRYLYFLTLCAMVQATLLLNVFMAHFVRFLQRAKLNR